MWIFLPAGIAAGFIDSIVGGGGLITVPTLMLFLGISPESIGTNKIVASAATLTAIIVYSSKKKIPWKPALKFGAVVGFGSILGAAVSPGMFAPYYSSLLWIGTILCIGALAFKKYIPKTRSHEKSSQSLSHLTYGMGFFCGVYDGIWGPGGGTFMFLTLLYTSPLGLMGSIAAAKIANFSSAFLSLLTYALHGVVVWKIGALFGSCVVLGAAAGSSMASKNADRFLNPLLIIITGLLLWKVALN